MKICFFDTKNKKKITGGGGKAKKRERREEEGKRGTGHSTRTDCPLSLLQSPNRTIHQHHHS